jgi:hypothetical protein
MKYAKFVLLCAFGVGFNSQSNGKELISLWSFHSPDGKSFQYCIEKDKISNLSEIDILKENPDLSLSKAAQIAKEELRKRNPSIKYDDFVIESIKFYSRSIGSIKFSFYEVEVAAMRANVNAFR